MALKNSGIIEQVKFKLIFVFSIIDMNPISFYLDLKVQQDRENQIIKLSESAYIKKIPSKFHFNKAHAINTLIKETAFFKQKTKEKALPLKKKRYQGIPGSLMFSIVETKPNITFATFVVSHLAKNPGYQNTKAVITILQYLKDLNKQEITYGGKSKLLIEGFSDSN